MKKEVHHFGKYTYWQRPSGGYCFKWIGKDGDWHRYGASSAEVIRARYHHEIQTTGKVSQGTRAQIGYYAILAGHERSLVEGKIVLGILDDENNHRVKKQVTRWTTLDEVKGAMEAAYPSEKVRRFLEGEEIELASLKDFASKNRKVNQAIIRRYGGLFKVMENIYPGLYKQLCINDRSGHVDVKSLITDFQIRYANGQMITPHLLKVSDDEPDKQLFRDLRRLSKAFGATEFFEKKEPDWTGLNEFVSYLTSIPKQDIGCSEQRRNLVASTAEDLTGFLFEWARIFGLKIDSLDLSQGIERTHQRIPLVNHGKKYFSDFKVGNTAIDVKTGSSELDKAQLEKIVKIYTPGESIWPDKQLVDNSLLVMLRRSETYAKALETLRQHQIRVLTYASFKKSLLDVLSGINDEYSGLIGDLRPKLHNLDYLLELSDEVSLKPFLLTRSGNQDRVIWSREVLRALTKKAQEVSNHGSN